MHADARSDLDAAIAEESSRPVTGAPGQWVARLRELPGVAAVLFYGSGLREEQPPEETVYDFYLLTRRLRDFDDRLGLALAGALLPPNVYFREEEIGGRCLRCKVAVLTVGQFLRAARGRSVTPHIWARFSQPCRIAHAENEALRGELVRAIADSVLVFHRRALRAVSGPCPPAACWTAGLASTYADEVRSESPDRLGRLVAAEPEAFERRTRLALAVLPELGRLDGRDAGGVVRPSLPAWRRRVFRFGIAVKRPLAKAVVVARLIKAGFTFQGGLDYARWKIERHSGVRMSISDFQRRHQVIGGLMLFWKAVRRGGLS